MTASTHTPHTAFRAFLARPAAARSAAWGGMCLAAEGLARLGRLHGAIVPRIALGGSTGRDRKGGQGNNVQAGDADREP